MKLPYLFLEAAAVAALSSLTLSAADAPGVRFTDATAKAGIHFRHNGGKAGQKYLPETMGPGLAVIDYNNDGKPDLLFVNSRDWNPKAAKTPCALYRNNGNGTFTDVTAGSGLDISIYGIGASVGDYDNDGKSDLYITAIDGDHLFHNEGNGKFRDVTKVAGINNANFATSAAWVDYDRDGKLDLFVANYVQWSEKTDKRCSLDGSTKSYCTPEAYSGEPSKLYHNLGNGKFDDVSKKAGVADPSSKSLGITIIDFNQDGWPDIFVANDTQPNKLYRNNKNGTFTDVALAAGVAFGEDGTARGAMGADAIDYNHSGRPSLLVGNFSNQMLALYRNEGNGMFTDQSPQSELGRSSLLDLTFGAFFFDYDLDGFPDIFCANGHIDEGIQRVQAKIQYEQQPLLFHNDGKGQFSNATRANGGDLQRQMVARGAVYLDFDGDGDLDIAVANNNGPAYLFRNDGGNQNKWIGIKTVGKRSNRDGLGAVVTIHSASGSQTQTVHSGSSYASQSQTTLTFGLKQDTRVDYIEVAWPSGTVQKLGAQAVNHVVTVTEQ